MPEFNTEREAWLYLAEIWKNVGPCDCRICTAPLLSSLPTAWVAKAEGGHRFQGLCSSLCLIEPYRIKVKVLARINEVPSRYDGYCWPTTEAGAKERVKFCLEQAEICASTIDTSNKGISPLRAWDGSPS